MAENVPNGKSNKIPRFHFVAALIVTAIVAAIILSSGYLYAAYSLTDSTRFLPDMTINNVNIGGFTLDDAHDLLLVSESTSIKNKEFSIICEEQTLVLNPETYITSNIDSVINQAFNIAKKEGDVLKQMDTLMDAYSKNETEFRSELTINGSVLKQTIHEFAQQFYRPANPPSITFDAAGNIDFTKETVGSYIDEDELYNRIAKRFMDFDTNNDSFDTSDLQVSVQLQKPKETAQTLKEIIQPISNVKIDSISDNSSQCNANIELLINEIHGKVILSGETFSMHEFLQGNGQSDGPIALQEEPPDIRENGIGQFAGLLYDAALWANMEILERTQQPYPSKHLQPGLDALVDDTHDLKLKNISDYPMYIYATSDGTTVEIKIYGAGFEDGQSILIGSNQLETISPPDPVITQDSSLDPGTRQTIVAEVQGCRVTTVRQYLINNKLDHETPMSTDEYQPIQGEYRENNATN